LVGSNRPDPKHLGPRRSDLKMGFGSNGLRTFSTMQLFRRCNPSGADALVALMRWLGQTATGMEVCP
jgi:hypothetical protein